MSEKNLAVETGLALMEELAGLTHDDVVGFLMEKVKVHNCPCCAENTWQIFSGPNVIYGQIGLQKTGQMTEYPYVIPSVGSLCKICGFIRSHNAIVVLEWKKENKRKSDATADALRNYKPENNQP